ncbi:hypothetical protein PAPYR_154 [Paratrimastix pyriformis]|uniref:Uncharacterized protein n=1 Tax=Paratrimastix pyriformis TaxID=342808 RepID=A0ABQ8UZY8_9EUKA|nr:hypothetical protein PAPYR_154 [Paratrimastix pyriformis]
MSLSTPDPAFQQELLGVTTALNRLHSSSFASNGDPLLIRLHDFALLYPREFFTEIMARVTAQTGTHALFSRLIRSFHLDVLANADPSFPLDAPLLAQVFAAQIKRCVSELDDQDPAAKARKRHNFLQFLSATLRQDQASGENDAGLFPLPQTATVSQSLASTLLAHCLAPALQAVTLPAPPADLPAIEFLLHAVERVLGGSDCSPPSGALWDVAFPLVWVATRPYEEAPDRDGARWVPLADQAERLLERLAGTLGRPEDGGSSTGTDGASIGLRALKDAVQRSGGFALRVRAHALLRLAEPDLALPWPAIGEAGPSRRAALVWGRLALAVMLSPTAALCQEYLDKFGRSGSVATDRPLDPPPSLQCFIVGAIGQWLARGVTRTAMGHLLRHALPALIRRGLVRSPSLGDPAGSCAAPGWAYRQPARLHVPRPPPPSAAMGFTEDGEASGQQQTGPPRRGGGSRGRGQGRGRGRGRDESAGGSPDSKRKRSRASRRRQKKEQGNTAAPAPATSAHATSAPAASAPAVSPQAPMTGTMDDDDNVRPEGTSAPMATEDEGRPTDEPAASPAHTPGKLDSSAPTPTPNLPPLASPPPERTPVEEREVPEVDEVPDPDRPSGSVAPTPATAASPLHLHVAPPSPPIAAASSAQPPAASVQLPPDGPVAAAPPPVAHPPPPAVGLTPAPPPSRKRVEEHQFGCASLAIFVGCIRVAARLCGPRPDAPAMAGLLAAHCSALLKEEATEALEAAPSSAHDVSLEALRLHQLFFQCHACLALIRALSRALPMSPGGAAAGGPWPLEPLVGTALLLFDGLLRAQPQLVKSQEQHLPIMQRHLRLLKRLAATLAAANEGGQPTQSQSQTRGTPALEQQPPASPGFQSTQEWRAQQSLLPPQGAAVPSAESFFATGAFGLLEYLDLLGSMTRDLPEGAPAAAEMWDLTTVLVKRLGQRLRETAFFFVFDKGIEKK